MQRRLTPRIPLLIPRMERTVAHAFEKHFPNHDEWVEVQPSKILGPVLAKVAAEALVGPEFSHDPTWVDISTHHTEAVFATATLRILPTWMQWAVAPLLPTLRAVNRHLAQAKCDASCIYMAAVADGSGWAPDAYGRLRKMDSVMRESQRLSPPSNIGMKRVFVRAHTFAAERHGPRVHVHIP
ncbi:unnamed protein product [Clonostachys solani]|uniref:Uncharacterized protein n=1 Tax=Clonostachys solani TaxID=160281 RepID=A0A9N9ZF16_9HYPO|nr:unnamed protein product [Clonostachys solani]